MSLTCFESNVCIGSDTTTKMINLGRRAERAADCGIQLCDKSSKNREINDCCFKSGFSASGYCAPDKKVFCYK